MVKLQGEKLEHWERTDGDNCLDGLHTENPHTQGIIYINLDSKPICTIVIFLSEHTIEFSGNIVPCGFWPKTKPYNKAWIKSVLRLHIGVLYFSFQLWSSQIKYMQAYSLFLFPHLYNPAAHPKTVKLCVPSMCQIYSGHSCHSLEVLKSILKI